MNKREAITNMSSCLNKAHEDEPIFVLRANDPLAAQTVESWAEWYRAVHEGAGSLTPARREKYAEAWKVAEAMRTWRDEAKQKAQGSKLLPAEALNAIAEKVHLVGDKIVLQQGFWITLRESLGLEESETRDFGF